MGLLDGVLGNLAGSLLGGGNASGGNAGGVMNSPLAQMAMQMLLHQGGSAQPAQGTDPAAASMGGLGGIIEAFQKGGLGHITDSWVGTGENLPVSGDQLTQMLGSDKISAIANQLGMGHGDVAGQLAQMLPQLINHITPNGQVPQDHSMIADALGMFLKR